jgi:hypothetical protein
MGTRFKYIADAVVRADNAEWNPCCQICNAEGPVFPLRQSVRFPDGSVDDAEVVCEACLISGVDIEVPPYVRADVVEYFLKFFPNEDAEALADAALERLSHSPCPMLCLQGFDWPLCCDDFCEFNGSPSGVEDYEKFKKDANFWDRGPAPKHLSRNFAAEGPPEDWEEVSFFRCMKCGKKHFIDQYT